jgi:hypothetical protein
MRNQKEPHPSGNQDILITSLASEVPRKPLGLSKQLSSDPRGRQGARHARPHSPHSKSCFDSQTLAPSVPFSPHSTL